MSFQSRLELILCDAINVNFIETKRKLILSSSSSFCRCETTNLLGGRRLPLGSVDSEDCNVLVDDDLQTLLPGTREISTDDLSQVSGKQHILQCLRIRSKTPLLPDHHSNEKMQFDRFLVDK